MAVSQIEEKILGRLAREAAPSSPLLSASLYQVLGLSILLSRKLYRARRVRKLDISRNTKSLQLYHQIIWLAREGLSITEVYILPCCRNGEQGPECQVMAAKLRASLYHVFCLFHNHPPVQQLSPASAKSSSSNSSSPPSKGKDDRRVNRSPRHGREHSRRRRRASKNVLRDPIPSMTSEASYVTNPYAAAGVAEGQARTSGSLETKRTPSRPPGLKRIDITPARAAASFLLPPLNFVPMAKEYFETAQQLADSLLSAASGLRLSISLEHSAFMWDCEKLHEPARKIARQAIRDVYASTDGLDDDEFADASALVQALGGIVRRGVGDSAAHPSKIATDGVAPAPATSSTAVQPSISATSNSGEDTPTASSTAAHRSRVSPPSQQRSFTRTPERLSTVPEDPSQETSETAPTTLSPPASRTSNRSRSRGKPRRGSSASTSEEKAAKRRAVEAAEELYRKNSEKVNGDEGVKNSDNTDQPINDAANIDGSRAHSRQNTPPDGSAQPTRVQPARQDNAEVLRSLYVAEILARQDSPQQQANDQRLAVLEALKLVSDGHEGSHRSRKHSKRARAGA